MSSTFDEKNYSLKWKKHSIFKKDISTLRTESKSKYA